MFKKPTKKLTRKYHDGDVVKFYFKPNPLDIEYIEDYDKYNACQEIIIIGTVSGEKNGTYRIELRDDSRNIVGEVNINEDNISGKISKC